MKEGIKDSSKESGARHSGSGETELRAVETMRAPDARGGPGRDSRPTGGSALREEGLTVEGAPPLAEAATSEAKGAGSSRQQDRA